MLPGEKTLAKEEFRETLEYLTVYSRIREELTQGIFSWREDRARVREITYDYEEIFNLFKFMFPCLTKRLFSDGLRDTKAGKYYFSYSTLMSNSPEIIRIISNPYRAQARTLVDIDIHYYRQLDQFWEIPIQFLQFHPPQRGDFAIPPLDQGLIRVGNNTDLKKLARRDNLNLPAMNWSPDKEKAEKKKPNFFQKSMNKMKGWFKKR